MWELEKTCLLHIDLIHLTLAYNPDVFLNKSFQEEQKVFGFFNIQLKNLLFL